MINVTKTYLPDPEKYKKYIDRIFASGQLTNRGPLVRELEKRLADYLGVKYLILTANGSLALQAAFRALELGGEAVTTPFTFPATPGTLVWQGIKPVFADINPETFNINPDNIEEFITEKTSAIVPVHVFGNPCDVAAIESIAVKHNLKVVHDAAHAFGVKYRGQSLLNYGDISTLSFHATKLFHTIEGGAVITNNADLDRKIRLLINFGMTGPEFIECAGTNMKMNELQAAMGLCVLDDIDEILENRRLIFEKYHSLLKDKVTFQKQSPDSSTNFSYVPVLFNSEDEMLRVKKALNNKEINPRRYFYPSLDTLEFFGDDQVCPVSRDVACRVLCLPVYPGLGLDEVAMICGIVRSVI